MGSGKAIQKALKKYNKINFYKEILFVFDNETDMNNKEKELITEELINNPNCYNSALGGEGGPHFKNRKHSPETIEKLKEASRNKTPSNETRKKIGEANKKRIITDEFRRKMSVIATGRKKSVEEIEKIRKARIMRNRAEVACQSHTLEDEWFESLFRNHLNTGKYTMDYVLNFFLAVAIFCIGLMFGWIAMIVFLEIINVTSGDFSELVTKYFFQGETILGGVAICSVIAYYTIGEALIYKD